MEHPFEYRAHYNPQGEVCHCPWGIAPGNEHLGSVKEASKLEWLEGRSDMQSDPRNEFFLNHLKAGHDAQLARADKMLPWLHREFKKGRILPVGSHLLFNYMPTGGPWNDNDVVSIEAGNKGHGERPWFLNNSHAGNSLSLKDLGDWQEHLEEMKKRGKGVDVMQHKVHELVPKIQDFTDWKKAQERKDLGEILHRFDDGWTVRRLQNAAEHQDEGNLMGHCIGGGGYSNETENGYGNMYVSLRDHKNLPHASMQISPDHWRHQETGEISPTRPGTPAEGWIPQVGPNSRVGEFYGKEDRAPEPEYEDRMNEWLNPHGINAEGSPGEAAYLPVGPANDVPSYLGIHGEEGSYMEYAPETDDQGRPPGEYTDYDIQDPEFDSVAANILGGPRLYQGARPWTPQELQDIFETARQNRHIQPLTKELYNEAERDNPDHARVLDEWNKVMQPWYHPYTGELVEGYNPPPLEQFQNPLFLDRPLNEIKPKEIVPRTEYNPGAEGDWIRRGPQEGPIRNPYQYWPSYTSAAHKPLYYRWVFSPSKGVTLGTNADDHPALVKYHQGIGGDINDTDLTHGYAYPIGNGWRLTDYEHQPVGDPFVINSVVRRLNLEGGPQIASQASWRPAEYDFDRLHYGLPQEKTGIL